MFVPSLVRSSRQFLLPLETGIKFKDSENEVLKKYTIVLQPIMDSKDGGVESKQALELVRRLDKYRKAEDAQFAPYVLEEVLNHDAPSIKPPQKVVATPMPRKKPVPKPQIVLTEVPEATHGYGTRRSRMLSQAGSGEGKGSYSFRMGQHLKRGISSDYVWDFNDVDVKDDAEE